MISAPPATQSATCSICGGKIPAKAPFHECPKCLMGLGLFEEPKEDGASFDGENDLLRGDSDGFDYELFERIGRGGMGVVYRARQRSLNRIVALKVIAMGDLASPSALARFRREAETAAMLDHPNIVSIIEIGERDSNPYLAMRFLEGDSLAGHLPEWVLPMDARRTEALPAQQKIAKLVSIVARTVDYAHGRGVLHRDLKPSNILLDWDGTPHLTDFGIAKWVDEESTLTQTAELLGTPSYMAPEQASGKPISQTADVYSLGAVLYELLTGRPPFQGGRLEVLRLALEKEPLSPTTANPAADRDLATICLKCLDKEQGRRYGSALDLAADLERWLRNEPILAREAGPLLRLRRWGRRKPAVATLLITVTVGVAAMLVAIAGASEEKRRKSIALDILRTDSARQLQEAWKSENPFFAIKAESLSAMAGMDVAQLDEVENRFTIALVSQGNPLDRVLRTAPILHELENSISEIADKPARLDLRLYKSQARAVEDLVNGAVDMAQLNPREFLRARQRDPRIRALIRIEPNWRFADAAVIFARQDSGIKTLAELRGKSFLFSAADSTMSFWAKVSLAAAGVRKRDLSNYRHVEIGNDYAGDDTANAGAALGNSHSAMNPAEAVLARQFDAAVMTEREFHEVQAEQGLVALHRFDNSRDLVATKGDLPREAAAMLRKGVLAMGESSSQQPFEGQFRFRAASEEDLKEVSAQLEAEAFFDQ